MNVIIKSFGFFLFVTESTDYLLLSVCLLIFVIQQVFAKPIPNMSLEANVPSLEETLRSPCRERTSPREDHSQSNIKGILQVIGRQSAIAKSIATRDVAKYVSKIFNHFDETSVDHTFLCMLFESNIYQM